MPPAVATLPGKLPGKLDGFVPSVFGAEPLDSAPLDSAPLAIGFAKRLPA